MTTTTATVTLADVSTGSRPGERAHRGAKPICFAALCTRAAVVGETFDVPLK